MRRVAGWSLTATLLGGLMSSGCEGDSSAAQVGDDAAEDATAVNGLNDQVEAGLPSVLARYDRLRGLLAADAIKQVSQVATQLAMGASQVPENMPETQRGALREVAAAAQRLADMPKEDPEKVRVAFGEVSRPLVNLMVSQPALRLGWHLFECPMAEGYPRWLQMTEQIQNPYMGQRMPRCGAERNF